MQAIDDSEYDIENETAGNRKMLKERIPARLNTIKRALVENGRGFEPWQLTLTVDLVQSVERNCEELLDTIGLVRLPASAWLARNLLELWVWVKYCDVSRDNAWRFHEDALRDAKGLMEAHKKISDEIGIEDEVSATASQRLKSVASEELGLEDIDANFLAVAKASKTARVELDGLFAPFYRLLSKFAHPTAGLVHGVMHQTEVCRHLQATCTTQGIHFAVQSILALEVQLGIARED